MKRYAISATLKSPVIIQQNRQSDTSLSLDFIPGSTLRGALAAQYIREGGTPDETEFKSLFLNNPVRFTDLLPTNCAGMKSRPLPLSAVSCKRKPGFLKEGDEGKKINTTAHGVEDILCRRFANYLKPETISDNTCRICGNDLKCISGFWSENLEVPQLHKPTMIMHRHTGIDRSTGTASDKIFFITQSIADHRMDEGSGEFKPQEFYGTLYLTAEQLDPLKKLIESNLFVGANRTSGSGEVKLSLTEANEDQDSFDILKWDTDFKRKVKAFASIDPPEGIYFSVMMNSHAILTDRFLRPSFDLDLPFDGVAPVLKMVKSQKIRGWQSSWGLPKPDDIGIVTGSVFLFKYEGDDLDGLNKFLSDVVKSGIGFRQEEGFGQVSICNQLHTAQEVI